MALIQALNTTQGVQSTPWIHCLGTQAWMYMCIPTPGDAYQPRERRWVSLYCSGWTGHIYSQRHLWSLTLPCQTPALSSILHWQLSYSTATAPSCHQDTSTPLLRHQKFSLSLLCTWGNSKASCKCLKNSSGAPWNCILNLPGLAHSKIPTCLQF